MIRLSKALLCALLVAAVAPAGDADAAGKKQCIDWPRLMTSYAGEHLPRGKSIAVENFTNYTGQSGDDWLSHGIRDLVADMLRSSGELAVLAGRTAGKGVGAPDFVVKGSFQHANKNLRVFIILSDGKTGGLLKQFESLTPYPDNRGFFTETAAAAEGVLKEIKVKYDPSELFAVRDVTASTRAYESYARGRNALSAYSPSGAEVAQTFFADAKRADYRSPLGYLGLSDLHSFLGFYERQTKGTGAAHYQAAEAELSEMRRFAKVAAPAAMFHSTQEGKRGKVPVNRFLTGNALAVEGTQLKLSGNPAGAREAFKKALDAVPEDALTWYHLSQVESSLGDTAASTAALRRAYAINPCVEGRVR